MLEGQLATTAGQALLLAGKKTPTSPHSLTTRPCTSCPTHPLDARLYQGLAAGGCAPIVVARLQGHVCSGALGGLAWIKGQNRPPVVMVVMGCLAVEVVVLICVFVYICVWA
jgi:hypothetical protein